MKKAAALFGSLFVFLGLKAQTNNIPVKKETTTQASIQSSVTIDSTKKPIKTIVKPIKKDTAAKANLKQMKENPLQMKESTIKMKETSTIKPHKY